MMQSFRYDVCVQFNRKTKLAEELNQPLQVDEQEFDSFDGYFRDPSLATESMLAWGLNQHLDPVSYTHLTLPTTPYV